MRNDYIQGKIDLMKEIDKVIVSAKSSDKYNDHQSAEFRLGVNYLAHLIGEALEEAEKVSLDNLFEK